MPAPRRTAGPSLLSADARRTLALHAGGDLDGSEATRARRLAEDCPDCRGHLAAVRGGLAALSDCPADASDSGLWPAVRDALPAVSPAVDPPRAVVRQAVRRPGDGPDGRGGAGRRIRIRADRERTAASLGRGGADSVRR